MSNIFVGSTSRDSSDLPPLPKWSEDDQQHYEDAKKERKQW